ncbi:4Fe-4S dicluster domain-containing protein [Bacteroidota bacterium]
MEITELSFLHISLIILAAIIFIVFCWSALTFIVEKEWKATTRSLIISLLLPIIILFPVIFESPISTIIGWCLLLVILLIILILCFPVNFFSGYSDPEPSEKYDERDIMFSRGELIEGTERFENYYNEKPDVKKWDDLFRSNPGLLSEKASYYHPHFFTSAKANFTTVKALHSLTDGEVSPEKTKYDQKELVKYLKNWVIHCGAHSVGVTHLKDYHLYSYGGRMHNYGVNTKNTHKFAIALTVEMDYDMVGASPKGPEVSESSYQYLKSGIIAVQVASFIRELGYSARAHIDAHFEVICPLVARDAGLGEIGRMGLLMTPQLGSRVRIVVITTELELPVDNRKPDYSVIEFCKFCNKCTYNCPVTAIPENDRENINNVLRWKINSEACYTYWTKIGTDCGKCMMVCPYSHPDYLFHKLMRFFIKRSFVFRRFAIYMDNFFYAKKPKTKDFRF